MIETSVLVLGAVVSGGRIAGALPRGAKANGESAVVCVDAETGVDEAIIACVGAKGDGSVCGCAAVRGIAALVFENVGCTVFPGTKGVAWTCKWY